VKRYLRLARPFTLFPPLLGIVSGAVCAFGSAHNPDPSRRVTWAVVLTVAIGSLCASAMNAASNIVNQIADLEIDRENKPGRPLVTGEISIRRAAAVAAMLYVVTIVPTWLVVPYPYTSFAERLSAPARFHAAFFIPAGAWRASPTVSRPGPDEETVAANLTIAVTRGGLLGRRLAFIASVFVWEAWAIGGIFALFCSGRSRPRTLRHGGDRAHGCVTLPIRFGVARAARIIAPFFVLPWLLIPLFARLPDPARSSATLLTGNQAFLTFLGLGLAAWGAYAARLLLRNPEDLATTENHPAWTHMYLLMMTAQIGFALAYVL
jgi:4-hydroxybenzoate polyprenyltransferase